MNKPTAELAAGDLITALDGHKLGKPVLVTQMVEITSDGTVVIKVDQPVEWTTEPLRYLRYATVDVEPGKVTINDRELATILDALAMTRDSLRAKGYTGDDCQTAWNKIASLVTPSTWGLDVTVADRPA